MSEQTAYYLQIASTFSVLLPLVAGVWYFRKLDNRIKLFVGFLFIGLVTDLLGWYFYVTRNSNANLYARHAYDLIEAMFLTWLISELATGRIVKKLFSWMWLGLLLFWATRFVYIDAMSLFKTSTQVYFAFAACFCILQLVETTPKFSRLLSFWILLGIFFYCFCTYFIMGLLITKLAKIWYTHNVINIATNLIYLVGFIKSRSLADQ
jgi:hypothetical protein